MYRKNYYNTCDKCGANLDPGERCECESWEPAVRVFWIPPQKDKRKRPVAAV